MLLRVLIQCSCQRGLKTREVRSSFNRVNIIAKRENLLCICVIVLNGNIHIRAILSLHERDDGVQLVFILIEILNEACNAAFIKECVLFTRALILNANRYTFIEKRELSQSA